MRLFYTICVGLSIARSSAHLRGAEPRVALQVAPTTCVEFCTITVTIRVPEPKGYVEREMCLHVDDGIPVRSCWPYGGQRILQTTIKGVPEGTYKIWVTLWQESSQVVTVTVLGGNP